MSGRQPHYRLTMKHRDDKYGKEIGVAWKQEMKNGNGVFLAIKVSLPVVLSADYDLALFPIEKRDSARREPAAPVQNEPGFDDDDLPF